MKRTGVFATDEEVERLKEPVPYMIVGGVEPMTALQKCHAMALEHGLPEISGYYGIDLKTKEFVTV